MARKKRIALACCLCIAAAGAFGNDGLVVNYGGGIEPLETAEISIEREDLDISYDGEKRLWRVEVSFLLRNPGSENVRADIAFINHGVIDRRYSGDIVGFRTWINDRETGYRYEKKEGQAAEDDPSPVPYTEFFVSPVTFQPGLTRVSHAYATFGSIGWGPGRFGMGYTLLTARKWAGPIRQFNLTVSVPPNSVFLGDFLGEYPGFEPYGDWKLDGEEKYGNLYIRSGGIQFTARNWMPERDLWFELYDWDWYRSYYAVFDRENWGKPEYNMPRVSFLDLQTKELTPQDLEKYDARDLRILRNGIYALHGYDFADWGLKAYFGRFLWYKANPDFSEDELTGLERANVALIAEEERKKQQ